MPRGAPTAHEVSRQTVLWEVKDEFLDEWSATRNLSRRLPVRVVSENQLLARKHVFLGRQKRPISLESNQQLMVNVVMGFLGRALFSNGFGGCIKTSANAFGNLLNYQDPIG
jgi:hypothetical protein